MTELAGLLVASAMVVGQAGNATVPDNVLKEFEYFVGEWTATYKETDAEGTGTASVTWSRGEYALVAEQKWTITKYGTLNAILINGWDTAKNEVVEATFFSTSGGAVRRYKLTSKGLWEGTAKSFSPEGTAETSKVVLEVTGPDEYTWKETGRKDGNGQTYPDVVVRFNRVKK